MYVYEIHARITHHSEPTNSSHERTRPACTDHRSEGLDEPEEVRLHLRPGIEDGVVADEDRDAEVGHGGSLGGRGEGAHGHVHFLRQGASE